MHEDFMPLLYNRAIGRSLAITCADLIELEQIQMYFSTIYNLNVCALTAVKISLCFGHVGRNRPIGYKLGI